MQATSSAAGTSTKSLLPIIQTSRIISPTSPTSPKSSPITTTTAVKATSSLVVTPTAAAAAISKKSSNTSAKYTAETDPNCEIEEISKKISEHADAIYRTWKCRGLVPAELLNLYTSAAAIETVAGNTAPDFFAASNAVVADDASSEGLQQLVKTFVINDKQQRSAKSNTMSNIKSHSNNNSNSTIINRGGACTNTVSASATGGNSGKHKKSPNPATTTTKVDAGLKSQKTGKALKEAKPSQFTPAILLPGKITTLPILTALTTTTTESTTAATTTATKAASKVSDDKSSIASPTTTSNMSPVQISNACANDRHLQDASTGKTLRKQQQHQQEQQQQQQNFLCTGNNHKYANDIEDTSLQNMHLASLNLNVNDLMQLQSQNLMKIKELLQEKSVAATAEKSKKISKGLTVPRENNGKRTTLSKNCAENVATGTMIPMMMTTTTAAAAAPTTAAMTMSTPIATITAAAQHSSSTVMSNHDKAKIAVDNDAGVVVGPLIDKNSNITKKTKNATNAATTPILVANKTLPTKQQTAAINAISISKANEKRVKTKIDEIEIEKSKAIKMSSISSGNSSSNNSNSNSNKGDSNNMSDFNKSDNKNKSNGNNSNNNNSDNSNSNRSTNDNVCHNSGKILREKPASASVGNTSKELAVVSNVQTAETTTTPIQAITTTTTVATTITSTPTTILASGGATSLTISENGTEVARASMPAPAKVKTSRLVSTGQDKNLGRPILTRGSVAERVLMFEKCPDVRQSFLNIKRPDPADAPPRSLLRVKLHTNPPPPSEQNLLQKEIRTSGRSIYIPRFYFPHGKPQPQIAIERTIRGILSAFDSFPNNQVTKDELPRILKLCGLPYYWRMPVMIFCQHGQSGLVERQRYLEFWKQMNVYCHDNASRFVYILSRGQRFRSYILPEDLAPLVQDVVDTHPGLAFLKEATEFHSRYVHTVIARIFYSVNRSWSGKISISELKRSDLLEIIALLEEEDDINQIMAFFSYEHFYVIYCKFWELDRDHDLLINQDDLARYSDHALSSRIIERIFSGCVTRNDNRKDPDDEPKMSYTDFVWFLLSEEDKRTPTAIEYWFRCMDMDGDGLLSMYELEYFYEEQQQRMESIGIETLPFEDCLCQMLDMIKPQNRDCITLGDLKRCKMTHVFFDTFFNLEKYLDHEQRDPFASQRDEYTSDWDRFAAQEYELLITEENE